MITWLDSDPSMTKQCTCWHHVTNHLIISDDKGLQHRKNRKDYVSVTQFWKLMKSGWIGSAGPWRGFQLWEGPGETRYGKQRDCAEVAGPWWWSLGTSRQECKCTILLHYDLQMSTKSSRRRGLYFNNKLRSLTGIMLMIQTRSRLQNTLTMFTPIFSSSSHSYCHGWRKNWSGKENVKVPTRPGHPLQNVWHRHNTLKSQKCWRHGSQWHSRWSCSYWWGLAAKVGQFCRVMWCPKGKIACLKWGLVDPIQWMDGIKGKQTPQSGSLIQ